MKNYPAEIEAALVKLAEDNKELMAEKLLLSLIEARELLAITQERNTQGKALFGNEEMRAAALVIRLSESDEHFQTLTRITTIEIERANINAEIERLRGEFKLHLLNRREQIATKEAAAS
jgi:hypothetical protein